MTRRGLTKTRRRGKSDLIKLASKGYWDSLTVKDGFHIEFEQVLPFAWKDDMKAQSKASLKPIIKTHLENVHSIADKKVKNTISDVDISHLDHDSILALFVKVDSSPNLKRKKENNRRCHDATAALITLGGTEISETYKNMGPK